MTIIWHPGKSNILTQDIGEGCTIHSMVWIGKSVRIGRNVKIEPLCFIPDGVTIEDNCFIGPGTVFTNDKYPPSSDRTQWQKTLVQRGASIGANCSILCGVTIGQHSLIGLGSVVTKDVPPNSIVYGNPATTHRSPKQGKEPEGSQSP